MELFWLIYGVTTIVVIPTLVLSAGLGIGIWLAVKAAFTKEDS